MDRLISRCQVRQMQLGVRVSERRRSRCYPEGPKRAVVVATRFPLAAVVPTVAATVFAFAVS